MNVKILVFSDSHGSKDRVRRVCDMHKDADYILHAGDGVHDLSFVKDTGAKRICVCGNCDFFTNDISDEEHIRIEGYSFYVCHGDAHGVKSSDIGLLRAAKISHADIVVFGHTHIPCDKRIERDGESPLYLFNPGSLKLGSFGLIQINNGSVIFSHGTVR